MKKILLAFDGVHFSNGAFELARQMNEEQPVFLTGIFLPEVNYAILWSFASSYVACSFIPLIEESESKVIETNIKQFESLCRKYKIEYKVHKDFFDFALPELTKETRFADLMIIG